MVSERMLQTLLCINFSHNAGAGYEVFVALDFGSIHVPRSPVEVSLYPLYLYMLTIFAGNVSTEFKAWNRTM